MKKLGNLTEAEYWSLRPSNSPPASFNGLPKIHEVKLQLKDDQFPLSEDNTSYVPLRPINNCKEVPTYLDSKHLASIFKYLESKTEYSIKNFNEFAIYVGKQKNTDDHPLYIYIYIYIYNFRFVYVSKCIYITTDGTVSAYWALSV